MAGLLNTWQLVSLPCSRCTPEAGRGEAGDQPILAPAGSDPQPLVGRRRPNRRSHRLGHFPLAPPSGANPLAWCRVAKDAHTASSMPSRSPQPEVSVGIEKPAGPSLAPEPHLPRRTTCALAPLYSSSSSASRVGGSGHVDDCATIRGWVHPMRCGRDPVTRLGLVAPEVMFLDLIAPAGCLPHRRHNGNRKPAVDARRLHVVRCDSRVANGVCGLPPHSRSLGGTGITKRRQHASDLRKHCLSMLVETCQDMPMTDYGHVPAILRRGHREIGKMLGRARHARCGRHASTNGALMANAPDWNRCGVLSDGQGKGEGAGPSFWVHRVLGAVGVKAVCVLFGAAPGGSCCAVDCLPGPGVATWLCGTPGLRGPGWQPSGG